MSTQPKPVRLSESQRKLLFQAAGRRAAAAVAGTIPVTLETELAEMARIPVLGAFVSFKRNGELRSCMGCMAESMPLALALEGAAMRAAKDDPRFAPISTRELKGLDMEVWVLWGMKPLLEKGRERQSAIIIGTHGLQISKGGRRGLLLPGVAIEHKMDALAFLEAVCRKAGLPNDAWADEQTELCVFEGLAINGTFADVEIHDGKTAAVLSPWMTKGRYVCGIPGPNAVQMNELRDHCMKNFIGLFKQMTPVLYLPDSFDGNVSGVAISLIMPERPITICSKIALRADLPLQSTLFDLVAALVNQLQYHAISVNEVARGRLEISVLWDPMVHGTAENYDVSQIDPVRRAMCVSLKDRWVVQYSPGVQPDSMIESAIRFLEADEPSKADVISFETMSTIPHLMASSVSKPVLGESIRPAAVAGAFYPSDQKEMDALLDEMLAPGPAVPEDIAASNRPKQVPPHPLGAEAKGPKFGLGEKSPDSPRKYAAIMVPHAGWIYSGRLAAQTFARVEIPGRVIVFAPKHRSGGHDWAVAPHKTWQLPGRNVESDPEYSRSMVAAVDMFQLDSVAHSQEHAIEVQLPILARIAPHAKVLGVVLHSHIWEQLEDAAEQFAEFLKRDPNPPLLVISTDMNHFSQEDVTRKVDRIALDAVEAMEPERLLSIVLENRISMCGVTPAVFVLETLRRLGGLHQCVTVGYTTSAARSGDRQRVVGYAGMLFR